MSNTDLQYKRVLIKLSGEALMGNENYGIDPQILDQLAVEIRSVFDLGVEVALVIGGGNLFRGEKLAKSGLNRVVGDHMGMLATAMNSLALQDALERAGMITRVMSAISLTGVCDDHDHRKARRYLNNHEVVIFSAGTGNPFFTTDSTACLRGIEIEADLIIKATKVDGVDSADPMIDTEATRYETLSYDAALEKRLSVMDLTAFCLARDHNKTLKVLNIHESGALRKAVLGDVIGTTLSCTA